MFLDGHIYGDGKDGRYACVDLETGEPLWTSYQPSTGGRPAYYALYPEGEPRVFGGRITPWEPDVAPTTS